jgi:hypothetical protein
LTFIAPLVVILDIPASILRSKFQPERYYTQADELVYDWNLIEPSFKAPNRHIGFDDETLRDGLQSPSVCDPPIEKKSNCYI